MSIRNAPVRANSYLLLNYKYKNWTAGIQGESYEEKALLNYNPKFNETNVATYFVQFKNKMVDVTAGYFYEQFGSGLIFRGWEDRALGINNALRGGRVIFTPTEYLTFKGIYGRQRTGFDVSDGDVYGFDAEIGLSDIFKMKTSGLSLGASYVGRDEETDIVDPNFNSLTSVYGGRLNFTHKSYYLSAEYDYKSEDAVVEVSGQVPNNFIEPGNALLINTGYSKKGFGIDATFRRLENMGFYSERKAKGNAFNDRIMNFIPSLTKQHHYNLANIYVYQAQPNVILADETLVKAGEIGGQVDLFYDFKKGTPIGGKGGMKVAFNFSNWNALGGDFYISDKKRFDADFFGFGKKYFSDYNVEITKKWNSKWQGMFSYINQYYNKKLIEETEGLVKTNIIAAEATYKFGAAKSVRLLGEHMWADSDKKNWAGGTFEFNVNSKLSFYTSDIYNYGNDDPEMRNHYYNFGGAYRKSATRIAVNYGRQRGGLVCVGGVCRFVPESTGISLSLNTTF
ncbi:DUF6029 family protein [Flavobacterium sp. 3HN19-14]|uniref:DUF6029 family protein n=1 Tax=Flavobacterium sp. 3HN19-14 TaxID=3448133 RepID=UPI003EE2019D